jgi:Zn finger protein HypA/HybF involved in hydrogenase expression
VHELSVALEICRMAEEKLTMQQAGRLKVVGIEVGDDCGLEPDNLVFCLDALLGQPPFGGARASLARRPGDVLRLDYLEIDDGDPDH